MNKNLTQSKVSKDGGAKTFSTRIDLEMETQLIQMGFLVHIYGG